MIPSKKELDKLIAKYQEEADKNYRNYQETGMSRYERAQHKAEDLADTLRMAAHAADDHQKRLYYQTEIHNWAALARKIKEDYSKPEPSNQRLVTMLINEILAVARLDGLIPKEETFHGTE